jgi:glucosamine--fructose-6-phosphate aminotransferase (isomerizing)
MDAEMREQPARLQALIERAPEIAGSVRALVPADFAGVTVVARGSSDHAAVYGRYLLETASGKPVSMAAPSLHTHYGIRADYRGQLVLAVSQSGATPEIVTTLRKLCAGGGRGLAITNEAGSDLAQAAEGLLALGAGEERAVPATKTVTAQLVAFALVAAALGEVPFSETELARLPSWVEEVLGDPDAVEPAAAALEGCTRLVVVARGYLYGAALEAALKIKETCSLLADGYSSADLRHGPIAAVTEGIPVLVLDVPGPVHADVAGLVGELRERGANVIVIGSAEGADISLPADMPEALAPVAAVVRAQQLARALSLRMGFDPDEPAGLSKVTAT